MMNRRAFLSAATASLLAPSRLRSGQRPNVVIILADDLGYGDLGCYGGSLDTPNLDQMAGDGARFTQFYSASPVCSPSRAALLTGRYPTRVNVPLVFGPEEPAGLPETETTLAHLLRAAGYRTSCIGKWHLGATANYLPTSRGFDEYFGIPYSHDMWPRKLLRNTDTLTDNVNPALLAQLFTQEAVNFIGRANASPFFLYMAHTAPHVPLEPSPAFAGTSGLGAYGDVVRELDWSVGEVLSAIRASGQEDNTIVIFSSDNGPWWQGSQGKLRGRKGETYEGGMRVPMIVRQPGTIASGTVCEKMASLLDLLPTLAAACGAALPSNPLDGVDIGPLWRGEKPDVDRDVFLYFDAVYLQCVRYGRWKLHLSRYNTRAWSPMPARGKRNLPLPKPELYDLEKDPQESYDCAAQHPEIVAEIRRRVDRLIPTFPDGIVDAWRATVAARVQECPVDGLPIADDSPQ